MDEYLFISMAKAKADRLRREREQHSTKAVEEPRQQPVETPKRPAVEPSTLRATVSLAASVVINLVALAVLTWSVSENQLSPHGEVTVTQLGQ